MDKKTYWNKRFLQEKRIWGMSPSSSATYALKLFRRYPIKRILVPGAGYGRNSKVFSDAGYEVIGVEISDVALKLAEKFDPSTTFHEVSVLDLDKLEGKFDAIYGYNIFHLFRKQERRLIVQKWIDSLTQDGLLFIVVFSERESSYRTGKEVEPNTFESKPGRPVHYFTESDLKAHFSGTKIIETGLLEDKENHGKGPHTHVLRYIFCQKNLNK
jgi:SAM-dependent methyltransferase